MQTQTAPNPNTQTQGFPPTLEVLPQPSETAIPTRKAQRNGRIARLPKAERDMVSRMLSDGVPYLRIQAALEELEIYGVTQRNISNWATRGGYQEWVEEQKLVLEKRLAREALLDFLSEDEPLRLPEVGLQAIATGLSQLLVHSNLIQESQQDPKNLRSIVSILCQLSREMRELQKYRDAHVVRRTNQQEEADDLNAVRQMFTADTPPENPKSLPPPRRKTVQELWSPSQKSKKVIPRRPRPLIPAKPIPPAGGSPAPVQSPTPDPVALTVPPAPIVAPAPATPAAPPAPELAVAAVLEPVAVAAVLSPAEAPVVTTPGEPAVSTAQLELAALTIPTPLHPGSLPLSSAPPWVSFG